MPHFAPEIGLLYAGALSAGVWVCAGRLARQFSGDAFQWAADTLLLFFVVQYASVGLPGCVGWLNLWSITATAGILSGVFFWLGQKPRMDMRGFEEAKRPAIVMLVFVAAAVGTVIYLQRTLPPTATDALTYHLPAAGQWLRTGRLGIFSTWFFNPANTFSPLAGSTFIAWWMAPLGGDVVARFAQAPALLLIFFALASLLRSLGCGGWLAGLLAAAAVIARPFLSQVVLGLDDLYLAAFVACALAACAPARLSQSGGAWRLGIALGMALATKYTAVLALAIFLPGIDAPWRARWKWRDWAIAAGAVLLLAGPWYLRNWVEFGNPVYPVEISLGRHRLWAGLFAARAAPELRNVGQMWKLLTGGYFGVPLPLLAALAIAYAMAVGGWAAFAEWAYWPTIFRQSTKRWASMPTLQSARPANQGDDALWRVCVLGALLGLAAFVAQAPYAEVRFLLPTLLLVFAAAAAGINYWLRSGLALAAGAAILTIAAATSYANAEVAATIAAVAATGTGVAGAYLGLMRAWPAFGRRQALSLAAGTVVVAMVVYVNFKAYVAQCRSDTDLVWQNNYPDEAAIWRDVRTKLPPDAPLAYANTYLVYPLMGAELDRPVFYVPARHDLAGWRDVPHFQQGMAGKALEAEFTRLLDADADHDQWLSRLSASGAKYLVVFRPGPSDAPPEWGWAQSDQEHFFRVFGNSEGVVYKIR